MKRKKITARDIHVSGDFIAGDQYNYYYSGDFASLAEYYISPEPVFQRVRTDDFSGRDWLTAKVDAFLNDPNRKSGAFLLIGDAGVGKTSFMAHLVKERRYLHLFAEQAPGQAMLQRAMQSLGSQLVTRYQIDPYKDRDTLNALSVFPDFLERILRLAASTLTEGEKIVIVCDALDEAGTFPDHFVFGLPKELPDGVYFILSQRPVNIKLPNYEPEIENIEAQGEDNLQDMESYLHVVAKRLEITRQILAKGYSEDFFTQTLKEKSLGVWMYLYYVIREIERGQRAPLELEKLPTGLVGYYSEYWDNWRNGYRGIDSSKWEALYAPLLATLAAAQQAISVEKLLEWSGVQVNLSEVARLLSESWSAFITEKDEKGETVYTLYHQSLRDFITGKVEIKKLPPTHANLVNDLSKKKVEADKRIVTVFEKECNGEWEKLVEQDYPRLHLTAHLNGAGQYEKLRIMLTEGDEKIKWAEAREQKEETYAGYLNDLTYVWDYAEREQNYPLAIRCMLIENSIHSLASNISPQLLVQLAKSGLWSYPRCLSTIRDNSNSQDQATALMMIVPNLPVFLLTEALVVAREIKDETSRVTALSTFLLYLNDELKKHALADALKSASKIKYEADRSSKLSALIPHLHGELKTQAITEALAAAHDIEDKSTRAHAYSALASYLNDEMKTWTLAAVCEINDVSIRFAALSALTPNLNDALKSEAVVMACEIKDVYFSPHTLSTLIPYLDNELKSHALKVARGINNEFDRVRALAAFMPYQYDELKSQILAEALVAAHDIEDKSTRVLAFSILASHLNDKMKTQTLAAAREIKSEYFRGKALSALAPYLNDDLKPQAFAAACEINNEFDRVRAMLDLVPFLNDELKSQALTVMHEINDTSTLTGALSDIIPHLNGKLKTQAIQEAISNAREINDEYFSTQAVSGLILYLNDNLKTQVLIEMFAIARESKDKSIWSIALPAIFQHLNGDLKVQALEEVLAAARNIDEEYTRINFLSAFVPYLNDEIKNQVITELLVAARGINFESTRESALSALVPYLDDELKVQALEMALEIKSEYIRGKALSTLFPHLTDKLKVQTLAAVREINDANTRAATLLLLAPQLNDELKSQALIDACEINDAAYRTRIMSVLASQLNDNLKAQTLVEARKITDPFARATALTNLAPYLNESLKAQVLVDAFAAAREIRYDLGRSIALMALAPHMDDELKAQALAVTYEIRSDFGRSIALSALATHLGNELQIVVLRDLIYLQDDFNNPLNKVFKIWEGIKYKGLEENLTPFINFTAQKDRQKGLEVVRLFTPALVHFRGPAIADELYRTITDVTRWWP